MLRQDSGHVGQPDRITSNKPCRLTYKQLQEKRQVNPKLTLLSWQTRPESYLSFTTFHVAGKNFPADWITEGDLWHTTPKLDHLPTDAVFPKTFICPHLPRHSRDAYYRRGREVTWREGCHRYDSRSRGHRLAFVCRRNEQRHSITCAR